ncbi:MAG TPA: DUF3943 domain-containing protein [Gemmatimonadales bacterium]|nr:DUF3943 domain-containing protein [Gemmatimonadales bacterium]
MLTRFLLVGLLLVPLRAGLAQDTTVVKDTTVVTPAPQAPAAVDHLRCGFCHRPSVLAAVFEGFLVNVTVNRFNAWVLKDSLFYVNSHSWNTNLKRGWDFDKDDFVVNMLGHPYNGSAYFATGRDNGLSYWAAAPLVFFHSAVWEYFGETTQPSINDLVDTGLGGIALGEMFHRVAATIRNNEAGGGGRTLRELAALPFDPVGTVNRLVRGEWSKKAPNPAEHNPIGTVLRVGGGVGLVRGPGTLIGSLKSADFSSILFADIKYGDSYTDTLKKPFDAFSARVLLAPGHGGLEQLVGVGRIAGTEIGSTQWHRHQIELNQRFEYLNNGALQFGAQTLQLGLSSRVHISGKYWFRTLVGADAIVLAAINAPGAGVGLRKYDYGPGVGGTLTAGIEHGGTPYLIVQYQPAYVRSLSGANADHLTSFAAAEANIPVLNHLTLTIHTTYYDRLSKYADGTRSHRRFPEVRIFAAYKTAHKAASSL